MTQHETEQAIRAALRGEQTAYRRLFEAHCEAVYATVQRLAWHTEAAEELTQDVFLKAFGALQTHDAARATFATWLQRIAYNTGVSYLRRKAPPDLLPVDDDLLADETVYGDDIGTIFADESEDNIERLLRAVDKLPPEEQHILTLRYHDNLSLQEMGYILSVSAPALSNRLQRIRKKLHQQLTSPAL
ncbi:MAG: RNA polymerase sigma factor [Bacteroidaceae bacterium]|nr:RNA polymerase sigma factor [Bacteroidaceae bacterium]